MKQNYLKVWLSACVCMCLSLCANVSAQEVTSFEVQRPEFMASPEQLFLIISEVPNTEQEWVPEYYASYNFETNKYDAHGLVISGEYIITARITIDDGVTFVLPYSVQKMVVAGGTMSLDLSNVYHKCGITLNDYAGKPFPYAQLADLNSQESYFSNAEGRIILYMPDGKYEYQLSATDYFTTTKSITMAGTDMNIVLGFDNYRKADFRVKDHKGELMPQVSVNVARGNSSYTTTTNGQGMATVYLPDGTYNVSATPESYKGQYKDIAVSSSIGVTDFTFEGYKRFTAKVKNGTGMDINVERVYLFDDSGDDDYHSGSNENRNFYYAPSGIYTYNVKFDATLSKRGMVKIADSDIEKEFDLSGYKKVIFESSLNIYELRLSDPKQEDEETWRIEFPYTPDEYAARTTKTVEVYLPVGEYLINGYSTPQTAMKINITQSGQRIVYDKKEMDRVDIEVKFLNSPVDENLLADWDAEFYPEGYTGSMYISSSYPKLPVGNYTYSVEQRETYTGKYAFMKKGSCRIDANNNTIEVDLKNYRPITFNVLTPDGKNVNEPIIEFFRDGQYVMEVEGTRCLLEDGEYKALIWDEGNSGICQKWLTVTVSGTARNIDVQFEKANTSIVIAELRTEEYEPVNDAMLTIGGKTSDLVMGYMHLLSEVPGGVNNYQIAIGGKQVQTGTVNVRTDETNYLTIYLESGSTGTRDMQESKVVMIQNGDRLMLFSDSGKPYAVSIYSMNGSKMLERSLNGDDEISIESFGSGVYILKMAGADGVKTFKFIKK